MSTKLKMHFRSASNKRLFFKKVQEVFPRETYAFKLIESAHTLVEYEFRNNFRESGEGSIVHHRAVMLYMMSRLHVRNPNELAAALLHDLPEDIQGWTRSRVAHHTNPYIAKLVWWVTKEHVSLHGNSKMTRDVQYHIKLWTAPRRVARLKLSDRIHNTHTLQFVPPKKQIRKVWETKSFYLEYAKKWNLPHLELQLAIKAIEDVWNTEKI